MDIKQCWFLGLLPSTNSIVLVHLSKILRGGRNVLSWRSRSRIRIVLALKTHSHCTCSLSKATFLSFMLVQRCINSFPSDRCGPVITPKRIGSGRDLAMSLLQNSPTYLAHELEIPRSAADRQYKLHRPSALSSLLHGIQTSSIQKEKISLFMLESCCVSLPR